ncbi:hypothetical protein CEV34_3649 [Brucella pseudogrignonensis]|uniref:Uncharacterized protein n=1 Tax=Brucella pseudogrignonensis TaxID=419475 RepID=A0A256G943_9HYPH|nr:hypothetical protein CEV34_3649 [Brucella pseudogrignonensis]
MQLDIRTATITTNLEHEQFHRGTSHQEMSSAQSNADGDRGK